MTEERGIARLAQGFGAVVALTGVVAGLPVALAVTVGWPLPHALPRLGAVTSALGGQSIEQQVTVTDAAPLVNTTLSSTAGLITEQQVKDLPLNGRSFDQLLAMNVGVVNNTANIGQGGGFTGFSVAGKRQETNRFMINGVDWIGGNSTG